MKYIMLAHSSENMDRFMPIIFPDELTHAIVAAIMLCSPELEGFAVRSAGSIQLGGTIMGKHFPTICDGWSETLNLQSHPEDAKIISLYEYGGKFGQFLPGLPA